jgi:phage/plasmid-associated DNA primase
MEKTHFFPLSALYLGSCFIPPANFYKKDIRGPDQSSESTMQLKNKAIAYTSDPEVGKGGEIDFDKIKNQNGGGEINGRTNYGKPETFKASHTPFVAVNNMFQLDKKNPPFLKRVRILPYRNTFVDNPKELNEFLINPKLREQLKEEIDAIFALIIRFYRRYVNNDRNIPTCPTVEYRTAKWTAKE